MTVRNRVMTRRRWLQGAAALGAGAASVGSLTVPRFGAAPVLAQEPVALTVLIPEHWNVVEGIRNSDPEIIPPRRMWFYERVKQWEQERPEITLDWQTATWEQIPTNFITASQAGNAPDIVTFDSNYLKSVIDGGYLAPLDGFDYDEWDDFNPYVQNEILSANGQKYGLSNYLASWGLMSNLALVEEAGFTEPAATWEDVITQGRALTIDANSDGRPEQWGFGALMMGQLNQTPPGHLSTMVWSQGGDVMDENGMALINTPEMTRAVQQIVDLINEHGVMSQDTITLKANDEIEHLATGIWAQGLGQTSYYPPVVEALGKENVGFAPYPKFEGGEDFAFVEVFGWHMAAPTAADARRAQAAFDWMTYMAANETLVLAAKYQFGQPSRLSVVSDPIYSSDPVLQFMAEYTATRGRPLPHMVEKEYWLESLMEGVHAAILEQSTVEAALQAAQEKYTARARRSA
jgi:ABC-type glycerol-3-phosphate transport system substrate-binding protein